MYMNVKPADITRKLVKSAILEKNEAVLAHLNKMLKRPFDGTSDGFDGIILFTDEPWPRY